MDDYKIPLFMFAISFAVIAAITMLMHEKHYESRKYRILNAKVKVLEEIITEERDS